MGIGSRFGLVFGNVAMLIPVFILLLVSAIMSSVAAANLAKLKQTEMVKNAHKQVRSAMIALWVLFAGGLLFAFTLGLFFIPWLISMPYLYGGFMIMFSIVNLILAGILFYGAVAAQTSEEFKAGNKAAKDAYKNLVICGLLMLTASIFMIGYAVYSIHKYRKGGGLTGDLAMAADAGQYIAPEFAPVLGVVGGAAKSKLSEQQQAELQARTGQLGQLYQLNTQAQEASGLSNLLKNPQAVAILKQALA